MKRYQVLYKGKIALATNVASKAKSEAWKMTKDKGWSVNDIEIKDLLMVR